MYFLVQFSDVNLIERYFVCLNRMIAI